MGWGKPLGKDPVVLHEQSSLKIAGRGNRGELHLNGRRVGDVLVAGWDASWTYGRFEPVDEFSAFALVFGRWSLLMHEDEGLPLSRAASEELRDAEREMDAIRARVFFPDDEVWHDVAQLNIDGELIEWKEF